MTNSHPTHALYGPEDPVEDDFIERSIFFGFERVGRWRQSRVIERQSPTKATLRSGNVVVTWTGPAIVNSVTDQAKPSPLARMKKDDAARDGDFDWALDRFADSIRAESHVQDVFAEWSTPS
jgi:hypothetical protein